MTKIITTKSGYEVIVDDADFDKFGKMKWHVLNDEGGKRQYVVHSVGTKRTSVGKIYLHRLIMNPPPNLVVDHINGNGLDNRRCNLRIVTVSENGLNNWKRRIGKIREDRHA